MEIQIGSGILIVMAERNTSWLYRAALLCGIVPLAGGIGILLLWVATRIEVLEAAGLYWIALGTCIVVIGVLFLVVWSQQEGHKTEAPRGKPGLVALSLLLVNFPAAAGVTFIASAIKYPLRTVTIEDVTRENSITLTTDLQYPNTLEVRAVGQLEGAASIQVGSSQYLMSLGSGPVDVAWGGDFYASQCPLRYVPQNVSIGRLRIEYRFR